ncbi:predicted protein [Plenodomus lingam JN3]|uniref:Predicted protein n=1 Tax=Leptosphaeria maculans (strain JN3 / isolate v23.1.3 / race Av1-4-5-6-7-8) TaxID=985895 RepID=E5A8K0_LEPMJ|nr:predicted protein [Plenodomus lingam JN3]CBX99945.1 predicted protein [Plenodomus lingam JN3]
MMFVGRDIALVIAIGLSLESPPQELFTTYTTLELKAGEARMYKAIASMMDMRDWPD